MNPKGKSSFFNPNSKTKSDNYKISKSSNNRLSKTKKNPSNSLSSKNNKIASKNNKTKSENNNLIKMLPSDFPKPWKNSKTKNKNNPSSKGWPNRGEKQPNSFKKSKGPKPKSTVHLSRKRKKITKNKNNPLQKTIEKHSNSTSQVPIKTTIAHVSTIWKSFPKFKFNRKMLSIKEKSKLTKSDKNRKKGEEKMRKTTENQNNEGDKHF